MEIVYTLHARQRMDKRGISPLMIEETLCNPAAIAGGREGKFIAFREFSQGVSEVVFAKEPGKMVVISVRWS